MLTFKLAEINDIEAVTNLRMTYLHEIYDELSVEQEKRIIKNNEEYLEQSLNHDCYIVVAYDGTIPVSSAYMNIYRKAPNVKIVDGRFAELYGVYTRVEYRKQGIATRVLKMLIEKAKELGLDNIELDASSDGFKLYRELGFNEDKFQYTKMRLYL